MKFGVRSEKMLNGFVGTTDMMSQHEHRSFYPPGLYRA